MQDTTSRPLALITGAAQGIGAATALKLAHQNHDIVAVDLKLEALADISAQIKTLGRRCWTHACDVGQHEDTVALAQKVAKDCGHIDVLVNNAGVIQDAFLTKMTEVQFDQVIRVNLKGVFSVTQSLVPLLSKSPSRSASIINMASIAWMGNVGQTNYSAAKAGVVAMTKTWALELARYGIRVNAVAPGFIRTAMTEKVPTEVRDKFIQRIPLKRMGEVDDIADLVGFLAGHASKYITGQCIEIDGGLTVGI